MSHPVPSQETKYPEDFEIGMQAIERKCGCGWEGCEIDNPEAGMEEYRESMDAYQRDRMEEYFTRDRDDYERR
jgi:hypothetical protein